MRRFANHQQREKEVAVAETVPRYSMRAPFTGELGIGTSAMYQ